MVREQKKKPTGQVPHWKKLLYLKAEVMTAKTPALQSLEDKYISKYMITENYLFENVMIIYNITVFTVFFIKYTQFLNGIFHQINKSKVLQHAALVWSDARLLKQW